MCTNEQLYYSNASHNCTKCKNEFNKPIENFQNIENEILKTILHDPTTSESFQISKLKKLKNRINKPKHYKIHVYKHHSTSDAKQPLKETKKECQYKNCYFTEALNENTNNYDGILFKKNELKKYIFELLMNNNYDSISSIDIPILKNRSSNQLWMLWNDNSELVDIYYDYFSFNWTISYRTQSEIFKCVNGCKREIKNKKKDFDVNIFESRFKTSKTTKGVYYVENCKLNDSAFDFAVKLNNIYNITFVSSCYLDFKDQIKIELFQQEKFNSSNYLFAFSFESANCDNFISKSFWHYLKNDLIPIVYYPNKKYYQKNAPFNSYIHVADFNYDAIKLSKYLRKIEDDFSLYVEYFKWKGKYEIDVDDNSIEETVECEICKNLNERNHHIYYNSVSKWFRDGCILSN